MPRDGNPDPRGRRADEARDAEIRRLAADGASNRDIGAATGLSQSGVEAAIQRLQLQRRPFKRRQASQVGFVPIAELILANDISEAVTMAENGRKPPYIAEWFGWPVGVTVERIRQAMASVGAEAR